MTTEKRRPGAPKKLHPGSERIGVMLSPDQIRKAREFGDKNVSEGIRRALDSLEKSGGDA